jgi:small subunit ribosomal protein S15
MLSKAVKTKTIKDEQVTKNSDVLDTGSARVQISLLSKRILKLTSHLKDNPKDNHSRKGLLKMVARRKKLVAYMIKHEEKELLEKLAQKYKFKI